MLVEQKSQEMERNLLLEGKGSFNQQSNPSGIWRPQHVDSFDSESEMKPYLQDRPRDSNPLSTNDHDFKPSTLPVPLPIRAEGPKEEAVKVQESYSYEESSNDY